MAGHSKWANIKRKKAVTDSKKAKIYGKLIKEVTIAARMGMPDPAANPRLRRAIEAARAQSVPSDNIQRAIKKGSGEVEGAQLEEIVYEAFGPGGVALIIESVTDNRTRTVAEVRNVLSKRGGNLGETGSVSWVFTKKGVIAVDKAWGDEARVTDAVLEAGGDDVRDSGDVWEIFTEVTALDEVKNALTAASVTVGQSGFQYIPSNQVEIKEEDAAKKMLDLMEALEDLDDVQNVYANFDISDALMEKVGG